MTCIAGTGTVGSPKVLSRVRSTRSFLKLFRQAKSLRFHLTHHQPNFSWLLVAPPSAHGLEPGHQSNNDGNSVSLDDWISEVAV